MSEYLTNDADLKKVADAIRAKGGTSAPLKYPDGFASAIGAIKTTPILQAKTVTPASSQQEVSPDGDYDGLSKVTVEAMPTGALEDLAVSESGLITSKVGTAGYLPTGTQKTKQLTMQPGKTITPWVKDQLAVPAGYYTSGYVVVKGDVNLVPENIKKDVSIFGVMGTHEGGSLETVQVTVNVPTPVPGDTIHYFDPNTSTLVQKDISSGITYSIPKNFLVAFSNNRAYAPFLATPYPEGVSPVGKLLISASGTNVFQFTQDCEVNLIRTCLIAGTLITLADGSTKKVEDITYDDELLVWDFFNGCFASAKPRWIKVKQTSPIYNKLTFSNGSTLGLVGEGGSQGYHRIYNKQAGLFTHTGVPETPIGTITFAQDETEPVLIKQELVNEDVDYYNIIADKHFNLFANGILTSCKCSNMYRIEDMKYVGERLMSDEEIEKDFEWREPLKA